ncbi:MAG: mannose-1-phosphate guanylyltransferase [Chitinophagales bacterium]
MDNKNFYVAIMAGGIGSRFWPQSRVHRPKQFLDILGTGKTLIQMTYERFAKIVPEDHIYIITGEMYVEEMKNQLPTIQDFQIVAEPARRNTGPCVAYIAYKLAAINPDATFIVAPSDHLILEPEAFSTQINTALQFAAKEDALVTLGIKPHRPDTGYGYIQYDEDKQEGELYKVKTFTEKPNLELAETFLKSGDFLWNSGIFIWNVQRIIHSFRTYAAEISELFEGEGSQTAYNTEEEKAFVEKVYSLCKNISIDYAVMEHAQNVYVLPSSFGWNDLGTWTSLWENHEKDYFGNAIEGENVMVYNTQNCVVTAPKGKMVVVQGLEGYCVVDTEDVLMICRMKDEQKIKQINADIKKTKGTQYL